MLLLRLARQSKALLGQILILAICGNGLINLTAHHPRLTLLTARRAPPPTSGTADYSIKGAQATHDSPTSVATIPAPDQVTEAQAREAYGKLPLSFEANQGQTDPQVKFLARGTGYGLFLSPTEAVFSLSRPTKGKSNHKSFPLPRPAPNPESTTPTSVVRMKLLDANPAPQVEGLDELPGKTNYFIGNDPDKWRTNIPSFAKVRHRDVYPGVDMIYYGDQRQLEYDFVVAPGANPKDINLAFSGMQGMRLDARGDLLLRTAGGEIRQHKPVVYQEASGAKEYVAGRYLLKGRHEVRFEIGEYDTSRPLVIDPVLVYSTYLGGTGDDFGHGIAVDDFGNAYVTGETSSIDFPTMNALQPNHGGTTVGYTNAFITKINASGSAFIYSTYLGGSLYDRGYAVAVDQLGSLSITGTTSSSDFPTRNALQPDPSANGGGHAFVAKLNPAGSDLVFSTYLGRDGFASGYGIATDSSGNIYVTGTAGPGWPTTERAFQPNFICCQDKAFIAKLDPTGTQLLYSSYLGNAGGAAGFGIAIDASQNAYITGFTSPSNDFATPNVLQANFGGGTSDAFVAKIATVANPSTSLRDTFENENGGVAASPYGNFSNWNVTNGQVNLVPSANLNTGLTVNLDGYPPLGATLETKTALTLEAKTYRLRFNVAIHGATPNLTVRLGNIFSETFTAANLPPFFDQYSLSIVRDIQVSSPTNAKLSFELTNGTGHGLYVDNISVFEKFDQEYVTFLGGSGDENRSRGFLGGIRVDAAGNAYVTGSTTSVDFPKVNAIQLALAGGEDAFIAKVNPSGTALVYSTFLGGSRDDFGNDLAIDASGNAFVVGNTTSSDFPLKNAIQSTFGGETQVYGDAFALKLSSTGGEVIYSTYLGGNGPDAAEGVAVDSAGNAFLTGYTSSSNFPLESPIQPTRVGGQWKVFVSKIPSVLGSGVPDVLGVSPTSVGNTGIVTFQLRGENFGGLTVNVRLVRTGANTIAPLNVRIKGPALMTASFDLTGVLPGQWDMVIDFSDGHSTHLTNAITINAGGQPQIWVDVIGPRTIRVGRKQTYTIVFGNRGTVDAFAVPVWIKAPMGATPTIKDSISHPSDAGPDPTDWSQVPLELDDETESITPILIPHLPAGAIRLISLELTPPSLQSFAIEAWANAPLLAHLVASLLDTDAKMTCIRDLIQLAVKDVLGSVLPIGCLKQAQLFLVNEFVKQSKRALNGEDLSLVSLTQTIYSGVKVMATCAIELNPEAVVLNIVFKVLKNAARGAAIAAILEGCIAAFTKTHEPSNPTQITVVQSFDPNDKIGSTGAGPPRHIAGVEPLRYAIYFENKATASAPAQEVTITDQLDVNLLDLDSFNFGTISFGNRRLNTAGSAGDFTADVDLRPDRNLIVRISSKLNRSTGLLTWKFISLDPATGLPPTDPLAGFLPPNVNPPEGDGNVFFTVSPKASLSTGTVINNSASIVFDENAAIVTPTWSNTLDNSKPASHVLPLPATQNSAGFNVQWSGTDTGSGVGDYTIYVSDNGGPFTPWLTQTTATQATFASEANHTYSFFSLARDLTGNNEPLKTSAEATTQIVAIAAIASRVTDPYANGVNNVTMTLSGARSATGQTNANGASSFASLPAGNYTVTPAKPNYMFTPASRTFNNLGADQTGDFVATVIPGAPILISEATSTRAVGLDSVLWLREPLRLDSPVPWGVDQRTRVILFAMNLDLLAGEGFSIVTADAEDGSHNLYPLTVEYVGRMPGRYWLSYVVVRLNDNMGDPGDVLIRINARGVPSNRVRLGVGHIGGGPPDDMGAVPTPGREP